MNTLSVCKSKTVRKRLFKPSHHKPFYRKRLEEYLGDRFSSEMYNLVLDEVVEDVERRLKALIC